MPPLLFLQVNDAAMPNNPQGLESPDLDQNGKRFEMLFEVNYVNQWLLTSLFLPQIRLAKGRVVNLVSKAYRMSCPLSMRTFGCMDLDKMPPPVITTGKCDRSCCSVRGDCC
jgi:hypothetical protein